MKLYLTYSAEDFACDDDFLKWVKHPDRYPYLEVFWKDWLREHPEKNELIEEARYLALALIEEDQYVPGDNVKDDVWRKIVATAPLSSSNPNPLWHRWYRWVAVIPVVLALGWFIIEFKWDKEMAVIPEVSGPQFVKHINNAEAQKTIILSDGTSIILQPHSVLEYPEIFRPDNREVYLTGQAFFEVARDSRRPFLVHAGEIVTRVLGTSFTVRNFEGEDNVLVQVKTGKVSVFRASENPRPVAPSEKTVEGVVLMPNQQVLYERVEMKMTKSLVDNPSVLVPVAKTEFEFVDAPIKEVFEAIEQAYGVEIVFDEETLSSCYLNASLTDVPLYDKLKLICWGINTTYEIIDSHIIIYGKGCNEDITNPNPI